MAREFTTLAVFRGSAAACLPLEQRDFDLRRVPLPPLPFHHPEFKEFVAALEEDDDASLNRFSAPDTLQADDQSSANQGDAKEDEDEHEDGDEFEDEDEDDEDNDEENQLEDTQNSEEAEGDEEEDPSLRAEEEFDEEKELKRLKRELRKDAKRVAREPEEFVLQDWDDPKQAWLPRSAPESWEEIQMPDIPGPEPMQVEDFELVAQMDARTIAERLSEYTRIYLILKPFGKLSHEFLAALEERSIQIVATFEHPLTLVNSLRAYARINDSYHPSETYITALQQQATKNLLLWTTIQINHFVLALSRLQNVDVATLPAFFAIFDHHFHKKNPDPQIAQQYQQAKQSLLNRSQKSLQ